MFVWCRYEPLSNLLGNEYFLHAYGPIYALSADVVASLVALRNNRYAVFFQFSLGMLYFSNSHMHSVKHIGKAQNHALVKEKMPSCMSINAYFAV